MLDTARTVETPEGIELELRIAGPVPRALAWFVDSLIRMGIYAALASTLLPLGTFEVGLFMILMFLLEWFYPVVGEAYFCGRTFGKKLLGLRVLHDDGTPVGWSASIVRNLLRFVDFLPVVYAFGLVSMMLDRDFRRLGDVAAGTVVVHVEETATQHESPQVSPRAPSLPITPAEQQVVLDFADRYSTLTTDRARELARVAGPLVAGAPEPDRRLLAIACWAAGNR